jgi:hypothetical protein
MKKRLLTALAVLMGMLLLSSSILWAAPAPVTKTGQTTSYRYGDDGYHEKGVGWLYGRFTDNGDGTVTDRLTGLIWAKDANLFGTTKSWDNAVIHANQLSLGVSCGSPYTDWRLPNIKELRSLIDYGNYEPALPTGHPFTNVHYYYWSSTTVVEDTGEAWNMDIERGDSRYYTKSEDYEYVWPVRGGN